MSNSIVNACRPAQMPPTPKNVLMAIADGADDHGAAWPSIPGLCEATCYSRSAVIEAIKWLEAAGFVVVAKAIGRNNRFTVNLTSISSAGAEPRRMSRTTMVGSTKAPEPVREPHPSGSRTGTGGAPVREPDPTRPAGGPSPVREPDPTRPGAGPEPSVTTIQPSVTTSTRSRKLSAKVSKPVPDDMLPEWLPIDAWRAYTAHRDEMRKPMSFEAQRLAIAKLDRWRTDGHDPREPLESSVMNGYQGLIAPREPVKGGRGSTQSSRGAPEGNEKPSWAIAAGFCNRFEAENEGCYAHNADQYRDGKRLESA